MILFSSCLKLASDKTEAHYMICGKQTAYQNEVIFIWIIPFQVLISLRLSILVPLKTYENGISSVSQNKSWRVI